MSVTRVQQEYWFPVLEPLRDAGELRTDDLVELVEWLTFFHFVLVARPATFESSKTQTRKMLRRYLVPALLRVAD